MIFADSTFDAQFKRDNVEKKPASSMLCSGVNHLNGLPPSLCGRPVEGTGN